MTVTPDPSPYTPFQITQSGGNRGQVTIKANNGFDATTTPTYTLNICARDDNGDSDCADLTINLIQTSFPPVIGNLPTTISFDEDQASGTSVLQVTAFDPNGDSITYTITTKNPSTAPFQISSGGLITTTAVIDYESDPLLYELEVTCNDGKFTVGPEKLTINLNNLNEAPTISNLPATLTLSEDLVTGYDLFTVVSADNDNDPLTYTMTTSPSGAPFTLVQSSNTDAIVQVNSNPMLDYESINKYVLTFFVSDGMALAVPKSLTIDITNTNEPITITNLPDTVNIPEDRADATDIFAVTSTDIDIGDIPTYSISSVMPASASSLFTINSASGIISTIANPGFDYENRTVYTLTVEATDSGGLIDTGVITVNIINANEEPVFPTSPVSIAIDEEMAIDSVIPVSIAATDPDGDSLTYSLQATTNSEFFYLDGSDLKIAQNIDFENAFHPRIVSLEITAMDPGQRETTLYILLTTDDIDDNTPEFSAAVYNVSMEENAIGGTQVISVKARDIDTGTNADFTYQLADTLGNTYFAIDSSTGLISVKQGGDVETTPVLSFGVSAVGTNGGTGAAMVNVYLTDVNDNRPSLTSDLFEYEVRSDANVNDYVGTLTGVDADNSDTGSLSYILSSTSPYFDLAAATGHITVKSTLNENPPQDYRWFVVQGAAQDDADPPTVSIYRPIRIDTYKTCETLMNFTLVVQSSTFALSANIAAFESSVATTLDNTRAKVVYINGKPVASFTSTDSSTQTVVTMLFYTTTTTLTQDNLFSYTKSFRKSADLIDLLTQSKDGAPSSALVQNVNQGTFPIQTVVKFGECEVVEEPTVNWWLETKEGVGATAGLSALGLALLVGASCLIGYYGCYKKGMCGTVGQKMSWSGSQDVPKFTRTKKPQEANPKPSSQNSDRRWPQQQQERTPTPPREQQPTGREMTQFDMNYQPPRSAGGVRVEV